MLSKLLYPLGQEYQNEFIKKNESIPIISYNDFYKKNINLKKYKIPQLKEISKFYNLKISGSKVELIERISDLFLKYSQAVKIQKVFRKYLVRQSFLLRGDGFKDRTRCVNESDFYSLEPINEIQFEYFFSFNINKFIYGCNIISLIHLIKNKTLVKNPYNRENIPIEIIQKIVQLYNLIHIIYGLPSDAPIIHTESLITTYTNMNNRQRLRDNMMSPQNRHPDVRDDIYITRQNILRTIQEKPIMVRIHELFIEIDQLGNYTQAEWFLILERRDFIKLYRTLYDIWNFRGNLSREMKTLICIVNDPFHEAQRERIYLYNSSIEVLREICLKIFEHMVYGGIDDEYRKIGTLHALSALTIVSMGARHALPWLYESLYE